MDDRELFYKLLSFAVACFALFQEATHTIVTVFKKRREDNAGIGIGAGVGI